MTLPALTSILQNDLNYLGKLEKGRKSLGTELKISEKIRELFPLKTSMMCSNGVLAHWILLKKMDTVTDPFPNPDLDTTAPRETLSPAYTWSSVYGKEVDICESDRPVILLVAIL